MPIPRRFICVLLSLAAYTATSDRAAGLDPGVFHSTPAVASLLDFGEGPAARSLYLATRSPAPVGADELHIAAALITGADADLFSTPSFSPYVLMPSGSDVEVEIRFNGTSSPGQYEAVLQLQDPTGGILGVYSLAATVIPEPATLALSSLGLLAAAALLRRRAVKP